MASDESPIEGVHATVVTMSHWAAASGTFALRFPHLDDGREATLINYHVHVEMHMGNLPEDDADVPHAALPGMLLNALRCGVRDFLGSADLDIAHYAETLVDATRVSEEVAEMENTKTFSRQACLAAEHVAKHVGGLWNQPVRCAVTALIDDGTSVGKEVTRIPHRSSEETTTSEENER